MAKKNRRSKPAAAATFAASSLLLVLALLCAAAPTAIAGCYRRGRARPQRGEAEQYLNHEPAKRLSLESMPREFTW